MKTEVAHAVLLLLLAGSSLAANDVSQRRGGFDRLMTKYNEVKSDLTDHERRIKKLEDYTDDLQGEINTCQKKTEDLEKTTEDLTAIVDKHVNWCPDPASLIPKNSKYNEIRRHEGGDIDFTCKDSFYQCTADSSIKCGRDRKWEVSGSTKCVEMIVSKKNPPKSTMISFPKTLSTGSVLIVKGVPTQEAYVVVNLYDSSSRTVLHVSFRIKYGYDRNKIIVNRKLSGWDREYRPNKTFPLKVYRDFTFVAKIDGKIFKVYVDDEYLFDYDNKGGEVTTMNIYGYANYYSWDLAQC